MFRQFKLATIVAVAASVFGTMGSADAHFGRGGGGGARLGGGGLVQRARQGNANGNYQPQPAPQAVAPPKAVAPQPAAPKPVAPQAAVARTNPAPKPVQVPVSAPVAEAPAPAPVAAAPAAETKPAEVASSEPALPQVPVGATVTLNGKDLSDKPGQVVLQIGEIALPIAIKEWKNDAVVCTLPVLGLTKASRATLHVVKADGKTASTMNLELVTSLPAEPDANPSRLDTASFGR
jgi:hypothetical protein